MPKNWQNQPYSTRGPHFSYYSTRHSFWSQDQVRTLFDLIAKVLKLILLHYIFLPRKLFKLRQKTDKKFQILMFIFACCFCCVAEVIHTTEINKWIEWAYRPQKGYYGYFWLDFHGNLKSSSGQKFNLTLIFMSQQSAKIQNWKNKGVGYLLNWHFMKIYTTQIYSARIKMITNSS